MTTKDAKPYELSDRGENAYVGELLAPWERIIDARKLYATIVQRDALKEALLAVWEALPVSLRAGTQWDKSQAALGIKKETAL